jgi:hypothetical protein
MSPIIANRQAEGPKPTPPAVLQGVCPLCSSSLNWRGNARQCTRCGFTFCEGCDAETAENWFDATD